MFKHKNPRHAKPQPVQEGGGSMFDLGALGKPIDIFLDRIMFSRVLEPLVLSESMRTWHV